MRDGERKKVKEDFSKDELAELCAEWQQRLRLQDWSIAVSISRARDFRRTDCCGECEFRLERKEALVRVLNPIDYTPDHVFPHDMERTLVHELLHLHFAEISRKAAAAGVDLDLQLEQAFHGIDGALVALKRDRPSPLAEVMDEALAKLRNR